MTIRARAAIAAAVAAAAGVVLAAAAMGVPISTADEEAALAPLLFGALVAVLVSGGATWLLAGRVLRPVVTVVRAADDLTRTGDFSRRISLAAGGDREVARLTETFNGLVGRVHQALEGQRQFLADTSHELRTPLTTVRGNLDLLAHDLPPNERADILSETREEVDRMTRLVRDLLLLAESGEASPLERRPVRLDVVAREVAARVAGPSAAARIEVSAEAVVVWGAEDRLRELVSNLVENALRHASHAPGAVRVEVVRRTPHAVLRVLDDGPGLPEDAMGRVFDRFFRVDSGRSPAQGGAGLGLAIVRHVAEAHGGRVWAENRTPEAGAVFTVLLPAEPSWADNSPEVVPSTDHEQRHGSTDSASHGGN